MRSEPRPRRSAATLTWLLALVVLAVVVLAACRQIVGIGDRSASARDAGANAPCGLAFPAGECETCMETSCCSAGSACAASPACAANEQCVAGCGADQDCVERCQLEAPAGTVVEVPALDTCLSTHCASQCAIACSAHPGLVAAPDAGAPCGVCIAANACSAAQACGTSLACQTLYRCEVGCPTLDCATTCEFDDAGTTLFQAYGALLLGDCAVACGLGQNWSCVGHVSWPEPKSTSLTVSGVVADLITSSPAVDAGVKLCGGADLTCGQPFAEGNTDENGAVSLHYTLTNTIQGGLDGYLKITSPAITPAMFFWGFPLSEPEAQFGIKISTLGPGMLGPYLQTLDVTQVAGHGVVFVGALDCSHNPAIGVHVKIVNAGGSDANTKIFYGAPGGSTFSATATSTDGSGAALLVNVPVGTVQIQVLTASDLLVSQQSFVVADGAEEEVVSLPSPM